VQESRDQGSAEGSKNNVRIVAPAREFGALECGGLSKFNLHLAVSSCDAISSCVAILYFFLSSIFHSSLGGELVIPNLIT